jgi:hypothetical protein
MCVSDVSVNRAQLYQLSADGSILCERKKHSLL